MQRFASDIDILSSPFLKKSVSQTFVIRKCLNLKEFCIYFCDILESCNNYVLFVFFFIQIYLKVAYYLLKIIIGYVEFYIFTLAADQAEIQKKIDALQSEVEKQDQDIHHLQKYLKEAENMLVWLIYFSE